MGRTSRTESDRRPPSGRERAGARGARLLAVALSVAGCTPSRRVERPAVTNHETSPSPAASAMADASSPDAAAPGLESLDAVSLLGPESALSGLCGARCRVRRRLPPVAPFKQLLMVDGGDPYERRNDQTVITTELVFEAADGWYGAILFRAGRGVRNVEMVNPRGSGMPGFGRMDCPVVYTGRLGAIRRLLDAKTKRSAVAIEVTRSDGVEENALVVCGARSDGHPACGELRSEPPAGYSARTLASGVVDVVGADGKHERLVAF